MATNTDTPRVLTVVIGEDDLLLREGVAQLLPDPGLEIVAQAGDADDLEGKAAGGSAPDPEVVSRLLGRRAADSPLQALSPTEHAVLAAMAEGRSNLGIAAALSVSEASVEKHLTALLRKLGIGAAADEHRRVLAVLTYLRGTAGGR